MIRVYGHVGGAIHIGKFDPAIGGGEKGFPFQQGVSHLEGAKIPVFVAGKGFADYVSDSGDSLFGHGGSPCVSLSESAFWRAKNTLSYD